MAHELHDLVWAGFDLGEPEGDTTAIVYYIPAGIEPEVRAFFGGALPDWLVVMPALGVAGGAPAGVATSCRLSA